MLLPFHIAVCNCRATGTLMLDIVSQTSLSGL
ncbi:MAG: hypothetical protein JWR26_2710 [Pedosphaera sp.]|nr:hypothetical protein [Pedosphaera sp.]